MYTIEAKTSNQSPGVMERILQNANWPTGCNFADPNFTKWHTLTSDMELVFRTGRGKEKRRGSTFDARTDVWATKARDLLLSRGKSRAAVVRRFSL